MTNEELNTALYQKMFAEQEKYRDWLLTQSPDEILHHCYEYTVREDIVLALEEYDLSDKQCKALLKSPCPLADVFTDIFNKMRNSSPNYILTFYKRLSKAVDYLTDALNVESEHDAGAYVQKVLGTEFIVPPKEAVAATAQSKREHSFG